MKRLIVGVDPGVTVGLAAALSLDGVPISVDSRRNWTFSDLIKAISELGEPTIISSGVTPASALLHISPNLFLVVVGLLRSYT